MLLIAHLHTVSRIRPKSDVLATPRLHDRDPETSLESFDARESLPLEVRHSHEDQWWTRAESTGSTRGGPDGRTKRPLTCTAASPRKSERLRAGPSGPSGLPSLFPDTFIKHTPALGTLVAHKRLANRSTKKKQSEIFASRHVTLHDLPINALFQGFPASRPVALEGSKSTKETRRPLFLHDLQRATNFPRAKGELRPDSVSRRQQQPPRPFKSDIKGSSQTQTTTTTNDN